MILGTADDAVDRRPAEEKAETRRGRRLDDAKRHPLDHRPLPATVRSPTPAPSPGSPSGSARGTRSAAVRLVRPPGRIKQVGQPSGRGASRASRSTTSRTAPSPASTATWRWRRARIRIERGRLRPRRLRHEPPRRPLRWASALARPARPPREARKLRGLTSRQGTAGGGGVADPPEPGMISKSPEGLGEEDTDGARPIARAVVTPDAPSAIGDQGRAHADDRFLEA